MIGAGVGGLTSALLLAYAGLDVTLLERAAQPGGKLSTAEVGGATLDVGPTVFTMRWVFDNIFSAVGERLDDNLTLLPLNLLARHSWSATERLDLFANVEQSAAAVAQFSDQAAIPTEIDPLEDTSAVRHIEHLRERPSTDELVALAKEPTVQTKQVPVAPSVPKRRRQSADR